MVTAERDRAGMASPRSDHMGSGQLNWLVEQPPWEQRRGHRFEEGDRSWQWQANCMGVDPDLFFPERGASTREAKAVCRGCVVQVDCLEYALAHGEKFGIWGGLSERERRRIRRQRALARRTALDAEAGGSADTATA